MSKRAIVFYLHVHQPYRIRHYTIFDAGSRHDYFNAPGGARENNADILRKVAEKSYLPTNERLLRMLSENPEFKLSLSLSGILLEQLEKFAPDVLESFKQVVGTGRVEILAETYHHTLAFFFSRDEFERQVTMHRKIIERIFGVTPTAFRNTELAYDNDIAYWADKAGYEAVLCEGWDGIMGWRSPNFVYKPAYTDNIKLLTKNYKLSDDIAFRFSNKSWQEYPLTTEKFIDWTNVSWDQPLLNLFMDYETFGEHQWADTGIFDFFETFVGKWIGTGGSYQTVTEAAKTHEPVDTISMPDTTTWADSERDLSAWLGNDMQKEIARYLYALENDVMRSGDDELIRDWRYLQSSDLLYYLSTKWLNDGDVHTYFSPYGSPYDAFLYYMNAIRDVRWRVMRHHNLGGLNG